jgi:hypothetical protein
MTVPDNNQIAEVLLTCEGFTTAGTLATKMVSLFSLARELLSRWSNACGPLWHMQLRMFCNGCLQPS